MQNHNLFHDDFDPDVLADRLVQEVETRREQRLHLTVPDDPKARKPRLSPIERAAIALRARVRVKFRMEKPPRR